MLSSNTFKLVAAYCFIAEKNYYAIKFEKLYFLIDLIDIQKRVTYKIIKRF